MSWLFGIKPDVPGFVREGSSIPGASPPQPPTAQTQSSNENAQQSEKEEQGKMQAYRFDSSALERAAKFARELDQSRNAKDALNRSLQAEFTKQKELQARIMELESTSKMAEQEKAQVLENERRKTLQMEHQMRQELAQYQEQLAKQRYEEQLKLQHSTLEANKRIEEESLLRQERIKKETVDYEMEQRAKQDSRLIEAKARAKARALRENLDISLAQIREEAAQKRITVLESINSVGSLLGSGFNSFFNNWDKVLKSAGAVSIIILGAYASKNSTGVLARYAEARLFQPKLIQETSRITPGEFIKHPILTSKRLLTKPTDALKGVILSPQIEETVRDIAIYTANTKKHKGKFKNLLLHGPPGTGKTLFAKKLAVHSGMDYAFMSGGDILPLGRNGVTAIKKVFDWANTSRRGLILFIDEADAFLKTRIGTTSSEDLRASINTMLFKTGEFSNKFMLVLASNTANQLDSAIFDRMGYIIEFGLPGLEERERLLRHYFDEYILKPFVEGKKKVKVEQFDFGEVCKDLARKTEGFSGREIAKMALSWQQAGYASEDGVLTKKDIYKVAEQALEHARTRRAWEDEIERARKRRLQSIKASMNEQSSSSKSDFSSSPKEFDGSPSMSS